MKSEFKLVKVHGTELLASDTPEQRRQKLARITQDSMVQFVGLLDAKGTVLEINQVALDAVGLQLADVEGKSFWTTFWWQVSKEINGVLKESILRAAQGEFVRWDTEIYGRAGGKETIVIDASLCPVKDSSGKVVFITAEGRDITQKKAYEREIAKKNKDLQGLLERVRELDEIKTQFFANVSHELRTPLQLIIGPADRLGKTGNSLNAAQRQESAQVISRNARMLLKHVNDLLDISKFEAGKLKVELQELDLCGLVRLTASYFDIVATDRQITYEVEAGPVIVSAVDSEKIQRVIMNLLSNAFKFVPDGGRISITVRESKGMIVMAVDDSGPGVKPELRDAIFERFRQGEGGINRQFGGTGLGLAIAKEFVEMHQGTLTVLDSSLGGACFRVALPIKRLAAFPPSSSTQYMDPIVIEGSIEELRTASLCPAEFKPFERVRSSKPVVLVVEDNPEMNRFIAETLAEQYHVIQAYDGQQGFELALQSIPALILTDIMMPKVSGVDMIARIRKSQDLMEVPIVLLSAKADEELKVRLLENGAQDFISKPFSEKDLLIRVKNLIELKQSQERHRTLFRSMDEGFCMVEVIFDENQVAVDYRFLEVNSAFERQTGMKNVVGRRMREIAPDHEQHWFEVYGAVALTGEPNRFESFAQAMKRWFEVYAFRVGSPELCRVGLFFNDVTERKQIQHSLALAEAEKASEYERAEIMSRRLGAIVASSDDAIIGKDLNGYVTSWNLGAEKMFGYRTEEIVGKSITLLIPKERLHEEPEILARIGRGESIGHYETIRQRKDGQRLDISLTVSPIKDPHGKVIGISKIARDITERRRAEILLARWQQELESRVEERTRELSAAHGQLRRELEERKRLEAEIAGAVEREQIRLGQQLHDSIGQQLVGLSYQLSALQGKLAKESPVFARDVKRFESILRETADQTRHLARDFYPVELETGRLTDALKRLAQSTTASYKLKCSVRADKAHKTGLTALVAIQLYRIAQEAVHNTVKYGKAKNVNIRVTRKKDELVLVVEDDGIGFPPAASANPKGMGQRIMQHRAGLINGQVKFCNKRPKGAQVTCTVPCEKSEDAKN